MTGLVGLLGPLQANPLELGPIKSEPEKVCHLIYCTDSDTLWFGMLFDIKMNVVSVWQGKPPKPT